MNNLFLMFRIKKRRKMLLFYQKFLFIKQINITYMKIYNIQKQQIEKIYF